MDNTKIVKPFWQREDKYCPCLGDYVNGVIFLSAKGLNSRVPSDSVYEFFKSLEVAVPDLFSELKFDKISPSPYSKKLEGILFTDGSAGLLQILSPSNKEYVINKESKKAVGDMLKETLKPELYNRLVEISKMFNMFCEVGK